MPGLVYPSAPRMGRINLPSVTSPTPRRVHFGHPHYSRTPSPGVRSPWLHGSPAMQLMHDYAFASSPNMPHLPMHCSLFEDTPSMDSDVTNNALGLIFDTPLIDHQPPTPMSLPSTLLPLTPQLSITHSLSPVTSVSQGDGHHHGGQEGHQSFLAHTNSHKGDAQASPPNEQDSNSIVPDDIVVGVSQENGPATGTNAIAAARSLLNDMKEMKAEGEAISFSILAAVVSVLEQKMSAGQLSGDDIDILDVIGSFHDS